MITLKNNKQLELMKIAGRISAQALAVGGEKAKPGVTTGEVNAAIHRFIKSQNAIPSFLGYGGFPASACISVNEEVIHGIPGKRVLKDGDIVSIDVGAIYRGYHGDNAATFAVGEISPEARALLSATKESLHIAIDVAQKGSRIGDIGHAIEAYILPHNLGIVRKYVGHGIGKQMHESPEVPNFGMPGRGVRLASGMTIAIEPMINLGTGDVCVLPDGWTVVSADNSLSAHFENTVAITDHGPEILTTP